MSTRRAYPVDFKLEVIKFAEEHSNRRTAKEYKIDESMVRRWIQNKDKLKKAFEQPGSSKMKFKLGGGRKPCLSSLEYDLIGRITKEREQDHHVTNSMITVWAKQMANDNGLTEFTASRGWLSNFLRRHNLEMAKKSSKKSLSNKLEHELDAFINFSMKRRSAKQIEAAMTNKIKKVEIVVDSDE